jgi:hypothetical protein
MNRPLAKKKPSAEAEETPDARQIEAAPVVAIAGVRVQIPAWKKNGTLAWQKPKGRPSLGAELANMTRGAIAGCDGDPLEVVKNVIACLPEPVRTQCKSADADPHEISQKIDRLLADEDLRSEMIDRRLDCFNANAKFEHVRDDRWLGTQAELDRFVVDMERVDRANMSLLGQPKWRKILEKVLLVILQELSYPRPDNVIRD